MMNSDKEKIISEEDDRNDLAKIPKTAVIKKTVQKPCFLQGLGVTLGVIALIVSLAALIALMGWKIVTPEFSKEPVVPEPRDDPNDLSFCKLPKVSISLIYTFFYECFSTNALKSGERCKLRK